MQQVTILGITRRLISRGFASICIMLLAGFPVVSSAAQIFFNEAFTGTISLTGGDGLQSSSINNLQDLGATSYRVESDPASATRFQDAVTGNNVNVKLYYSIGGTNYVLTGQVSRQEKSGSTIRAFYFYETSTQKGYLLVRRGYESVFSVGNNIGNPPTGVRD